MRTDIKVVLMLVDPTLTSPATEGSRTKSLSQIQAYINSLITKSELVKYQVGPCGKDLLFEIIIKKK